MAHHAGRHNFLLVMRLNFNFSKLGESFTLTFFVAFVTHEVAGFESHAVGLEQ